MTSRYGYRRVSATLRRQGLVVNHKKVLRLMRQDNLLAVCQGRFVLTTDAGHFLPVYPHLAANPRVDGVERLRPSDITCIRLRETFVYLAVVLDAHSRRVIGWRLGTTLEAELAVGALRAFRGPIEAAKFLRNETAPSGLIVLKGRQADRLGRVLSAIFEPAGG